MENSDSPDMLQNDNVSIHSSPPLIPLQGSEEEQNSPSTESEVSHPLRDSSFYMEPVIFQVGNTLFRVDKRPLKVPGTIFEPMLSLPVPEGNPAGIPSVEGESDENPIYLHGVDETKFKAFLTFLLRPRNILHDEEDRYGMYINALELATLWGFKKLRNELITKATPLVERRSPIEIVSVAKAHRVYTWMLTAYRMLIRDCNTLPMEQLLESNFDIDWQTLAKIYIIRDAITRQYLDGTPCSQCGSLSNLWERRNDFRQDLCDCSLSQFIDTYLGVELDLLRENPFDTEDVVEQASTGMKKKKRRKQLNSDL